MEKIEKRYSIQELKRLLETYSETLDDTRHSEFICEIDFVKSGASQFLEWLDEKS